MTAQYDVIVVGAGPAGYVAAIRCAQLGLKTAVVESWLGKSGAPALGGTCLNVGCIPSKALLDTSERFHQMQTEAQPHGIKIKQIDIDIKAMIARKDAVVQQLTGGIAGLFKANDIEWLQGSGQLQPGNKVSVKPHKGKAATYPAKHIILATGSVPIDIAAAKCDDKHIVDSSGALDFDVVPGKLAIIGAGVIGLELGSVWKRLGAEVILLEAQEEFLAAADKQIAREALKQFKVQGLDIRLSAKVTGCKATAKKVTVKYTDNEGDKQIDVDKVLVAVGRRPCTDGLFGKGVDIKCDERGFIAVDGQCRTNLPNVYAIGDVVPGPMLAHKGSEEGIAVAEIIAGQNTPISHALVPWVTYTEPEIAWVGQTEQQLKAQNMEFKVGMFPLAATGRALAMNATSGFVKILADADSDRILGVHIIAHAASELIAEAVLAMSFDASAEDIARTIHAHPTLSEALHEAAMDAGGWPIHKAGRRRK